MLWHDRSELLYYQDMDYIHLDQWYWSLNQRFQPSTGWLDFIAGCAGVQNRRWPMAFGFYRAVQSIHLGGQFALFT
jgi:hypothetical protein